MRSPPHRPTVPFPLLYLSLAITSRTVARLSFFYTTLIQRSTSLDASFQAYIYRYTHIIHSSGHQKTPLTMVATSLLAASVAAILSSAAAEQFVMYTPGGDDTAVERIDSILNPGSIAQHVHQVFGSNALSNDVSYDSLQTSTCTTMGDASGDGVQQDHSIYWHPALFMEKNDGSGFLRVPTNGHKIYYQDAGNSADVKADPFEFPKGFRMIAGNPFLRAANPNIHQQNITQW